MKSNRGSISIFMLLIVPILAIGVFILYNHLKIYKMDNQVLKTVRNFSEVQLANNNAHLFDNYGILSYLDQDIIESQGVAHNDQISVLDLDVDHFSLDDPTIFFDATMVASKNMIAIEIVDSMRKMMTPYLEKDLSNDFLQVMKTFEEKTKQFFDFQKEAKKIEKLLTSKHPESILDNIQADIESKLNDVLSSYEKLIESDMGFARSQIDQYKISMNEAIRISEEWVSRIADLRRLNEEISGVRKKLFELNTEIIDSEDESFETQKSDLMHRLSVLEETWNDTIDQIIVDHKNIKPKLLDKIAELSSTIDEMLFDLEPVESLTLPIDGLNSIQSNVSDNTEMSFLEGLLYDEYWLSVLKSFDTGSARNFNPLGTKGDRESVIKGEVEFLVVGKLSDPQNVQGIKLRLFSMRSVANMVHIASDATKTSQISRLTAPFPTPWNGVAYGALMTLWSSAEGYLDMIALFKGEGHRFIKNEEEWHLSLDNLLLGSISSNIKANGDQTDQSSDGKLYYQDYLRIMLYAQSKEVTAKRGMVLLDANLQNASNKRFNLGHFSIGHKIDLSYMIRGLDDSHSVMSMVNKY